MTDQIPSPGEACSTPKASEPKENRRGFGILVGAAAAGILSMFYQPREARAALSFDDVKKGVGEVFGAGGDAVKNIAGEIGGLFNKAADTLKGLIKAIVEAILEQVIKPIIRSVVGNKGLNGLDAWPNALHQGPDEILRGLSVLHDVLERLGGGRRNEISNRIKAVDSSIKALKTSIGIKDGPLAPFADMPFKILDRAFQTGLDDPKALLNEILLSSLDATKVVDFIFDGLLNSNKSISNCFQMPKGLSPGVLNDWVNGAPAGSLTLEERQFRLRIAAEFDKYVRGTASRTLKGELVGTDKSTSTQLLLEVIGLLLNTTLTFVFEPVQFPDLPEEWKRFEDAGEEYARTAGRQLRVAVQAAIGSVLRGIWAYNVYNDNLIEGVATLFGTLVSGITEGLIRNLAFEFEVAAIYPNCDFDKWSKLSIVPPFESWETVELTLAPADRLKYVILVRGFPGDEQMAAKLRELIGGNGNPVQGALKDLAAYNDIAASGHRHGIRFSPIVSDAITLDRLDLIGDNLKVEAHSAPLTDNSVSGPAPVFRVYVAQQIVVMRPEIVNGRCTGKYSASVRVRKSYLPQAMEVSVVSSRGGVVKRTVQVAGI